jgi:hypothetical protein
MIKNNIEKLCTNYKQIENYEKAIADTEQTWHCHHRLEIHEDYTNSVKHLKMMNLYYNRPPEELIFLTSAEHSRLYAKRLIKTEQHRENLRNSLIKYWSNETRHEEWSDKIREGIESYWSEKPQEEYVLGKRYRQKIDGKRYKIGYRLFQRDYQKKFRAEHPAYYAYLRQKKEGKTDLSYEDWYKTYEPYKRINKEN